MEADLQTLLPPNEKANEEFSEKVMKPTVLVLADQFVVPETNTATPIYRMSWSVTSIPQKGTSLVFERVGHEPAEKDSSTAPGKRQSRHLFYLARPAGAQFQTDTPRSYVTSVSDEMLGNINLETSKSRFQKPEFKALLSEKRTASSIPLFDEKAQCLFDIKPRWIGGRYKWTDSNGRDLAYEAKEAKRHKLVITASMGRAMREALVAMWCLRLWHDTAESRRARRDGKLDFNVDGLAEHNWHLRLIILQLWKGGCCPNPCKGMVTINLIRRPREWLRLALSVEEVAEGLSANTPFQSVV